jgi:hypothetical protein
MKKSKCKVIIELLNNTRDIEGRYPVVMNRVNADDAVWLLWFFIYFFNFRCAVNKTKDENGKTYHNYVKINFPRNALFQIRIAEELFDRENLTNCYSVLDFADKARILRSDNSGYINKLYPDWLLFSKYKTFTGIGKKDDFFNYVLKIVKNIYGEDIFDNLKIAPQEVRHAAMCGVPPSTKIIKILPKHLKNTLCFQQFFKDNKNDVSLNHCDDVSLFRLLSEFQQYSINKMFTDIQDYSFSCVVFDTDKDFVFTSKDRFVAFDFSGCYKHDPDDTNLSQDDVKELYFKSHFLLKDEYEYHVIFRRDYVQKREFLQKVENIEMLKKEANRLMVLIGDAGCYDKILHQHGCFILQNHHHLPRSFLQKYSLSQSNPSYCILTSINCHKKIHASGDDVLRVFKGMSEAGMSVDDLEIMYKKTFAAIKAEEKQHNLKDLASKEYRSIIEPELERMKSSILCHA